MQPDRPREQSVRAQVQSLHPAQNAQRQRSGSTVRRFKLKSQIEPVLAQPCHPAQRLFHTLKRHFIQGDHALLQRRLLEQRREPQRMMFGFQSERVIPVLIALRQTGNQQQLRTTGSHNASIAVFPAQIVEQRGIHRGVWGWRFPFKAHLQARIIHRDEQAEITHTRRLAVCLPVILA